MQHCFSTITLTLCLFRARHCREKSGTGKGAEKSYPSPHQIPLSCSRSGREITAPSRNSLMKPQNLAEVNTTSLQHYLPLGAVCPQRMVGCRNWQGINGSPVHKKTLLPEGRGTQTEVKRGWFSLQMPPSAICLRADFPTDLWPSYYLKNPLCSCNPSLPRGKNRVVTL